MSRYERRSANAFDGGNDGAHRVVLHTGSTGMARIDGADGVQALAAVIRRQVESLARPVVTGASIERADESGKTLARRRAKTGDLASVVARRVRALDPTDPDAGRQAFRIFLESVLLAEFGEHLMNDPAFHQLVDDVQEQMEAHPALKEMMTDAAVPLLGRGAD